MVVKCVSWWPRSIRSSAAMVLWFWAGSDIEGNVEVYCWQDL